MSKGIPTGNVRLKRAYEQLRELAREGPITLVYSAHDEEHNDAVVRREVLNSGHAKRARRGAQAKPLDRNA